MTGSGSHRLARLTAAAVAAIAILGPTTGEAAHADPPPPGPLVAEKYSSQFHGPGFTFFLPPSWTVTLDDIPPGEGQYGERGTARGGAYNDDPAAIAAADASIRFEPFPLEPGTTATLDQYEAHIRETLAADLPMARLPLLRVADPLDGRIPSPDRPEGMTLLFTRPGDDGTEATQRRYFVYALPRADGRLQTLVCSHKGPAGLRRFSILLMQAGELFDTTEPDIAGQIRIDERGFALDVPPGWRRYAVGYCGNSFMFETEEQRQRALMPVANLIHADGAKPEDIRGRPTVEFTTAEVFDEVPAAWLRRIFSAPVREFAFADGGAGVIAETGSSIIILRWSAPRVAKAMAMNVTPDDRETVLALIRGMRLIEPSPPGKETIGPAQFRMHNLVMNCPESWKAVVYDHNRHPKGNTTLGRFAIAEPSKQDDQTHIVNHLQLSLQRLDDVLAERRRMREFKPEPDPRVKQPPMTTEFEDLPFTTTSGWNGWQFHSTSRTDGPRGRSEVCTVEYILPMPDGVTALLLTASSSTGPRHDPKTAAALHRTWHDIAASVQLDKP